MSSLPEEILDIISFYLYPVEIAQMSVVLNRELDAIKLYRFDGLFLPLHSDKKLSEMASQISNNGIFYNLRVRDYDEESDTIFSPKLREFTDSGQPLQEIPSVIGHLILKGSPDYLHPDYQKSLKNIKKLTLDGCRVRRLDPKLKFSKLHTICFDDTIHTADNKIRYDLDKFWNTHFRNVRKLEFKQRQSKYSVPDFIIDLEFVYAGHHSLESQLKFPKSLKRLKVLIAETRASLDWIAELHLDELVIRCDVYIFQSLELHETGQSLFANIKKLTIFVRKHPVTYLTEMKLDLGENCNIEELNIQMQRFDPLSLGPSESYHMIALRLPELPKLHSLVTNLTPEFGDVKLKLKSLYLFESVLPKTLPQSLEELYFNGSIEPEGFFQKIQTSK